MNPDARGGANQELGTLTLAIVMPSLHFTGHYCYEIISLTVYADVSEEGYDFTTCGKITARARFASILLARDFACLLACGVAKESVTLFVQSAAELAWRLATAEPPAPTPTHPRTRTRTHVIVAAAVVVFAAVDRMQQTCNFKGDQLRWRYYSRPARYRRLLSQSYHLSSSSM